MLTPVFIACCATAVLGATQLYNGVKGAVADARESLRQRKEKKKAKEET